MALSPKDRINAAPPRIHYTAFPEPVQAGNSPLGGCGHEESGAKPDTEPIARSGRGAAGEGRCGQRVEMAIRLGGARDAVSTRHGQDLGQGVLLSRTLGKNPDLPGTACLAQHERPGPVVRGLNAVSIASFGRRA